MAKKNKPRRIPEVLLLTDTNHYPDALASLVVFAWLADRNEINLRGVMTEVGSYETRRRRAMCAKGALVHLRQPFVRVVPGGDYQPIDEAEENTYPMSQWTPVLENLGTGILRSGAIFLQGYIKSAPEKSVCLVLNAPFVDVMKYIQTAGAALAKKLKKIVVMGSVLPQKDGQGHYLPDLTSYNFQVGVPAANELFEYARTYGIRLVIITSAVVKSLTMKYEFLDAVAQSKNPVFQQLESDRCDLPRSMHYDMLSALSVVESEFKSAGGVYEQAEAPDQNIFFAKVADPDLMTQKFVSIFKDKFAPKKITLDQLKRTHTHSENTTPDTKDKTNA